MKKTQNIRNVTIADTMTVNPLPAKTWYWLNMNASEVDLSDISETALATASVSQKSLTKGSIGENAVNNSEEAPKQYIAYPTINSLSEKLLIKNTGFTFRPVNKEEERLFANIETGMGEDMNSFMEKVPSYLLKNETDEKQMAVFDLNAPTGSKAFYKLYIYAKKDSETEVSILNSNIVDVEKAISGLSSIQIKIYAEENAKVHLSMAQTLEKSEICFWDIGGELKENASVQIIKLEAGSKKAYTGTLMKLSGTESSFDAQIGYYGKDKQKLDMNYVARHTGKRTVSSMETNGVLEDGAFKLFRGSIDFKPGCSGAKGDEKEEVLLLGDDVVNQTIPLILCSEEDVEGNHGASIGNLDEKTMFYLESRGFSEEAAQNMVARARIDSICEKIADEYVKEKVERKLDTI